MQSTPETGLVTGLRMGGLQQLQMLQPEWQGVFGKWVQGVGEVVGCVGVGGEEGVAGAPPAPFPPQQTAGRCQGVGAQGLSRWG